MSTRRHRLFGPKVTYPSIARIEERSPEVSTRSRSPARREIVIIKTTKHRGGRERVERRPSPTRPRRSAISRSPVRRLPSPFADSLITMSPKDSPSSGPKKFVPLPNPLPTKEEEEKAKKERELKQKPKVYHKEHKPRRSADSGFASLSHYIEDRTPEQYNSSPKQSSNRQPDTQVYEQIAGRSGSGNKYIMKDGKRVRVVSRNPDSPIDEEYGPPGLPRRDDKYKTKYKQVREASRNLEAVMVDTIEANEHNYDAARAQEAKYTALMDELSSLRLVAKQSEARAAEKDRLLMEAQRKLRLQEVELQLEEIRKDRERLSVKTIRDDIEDRPLSLTVDKRKSLERQTLDDFARRQNEEIAASPSPISRRRPTFVDQPQPPTRSALVPTTGFSAPALTSTVMSPTFTDPLDEARDDYEKARAGGRKPSTNAKVLRPRDDRRYK